MLWANERSRASLAEGRSTRLHLPHSKAKRKKTCPKNLTSLPSLTCQSARLCLRRQQMDLIPPFRTVHAIIDSWHNAANPVETVSSAQSGSATVAAVIKSAGMSALDAARYTPASGSGIRYILL